MKLNITKFIAMLTIALFAINAQAQNLATEPNIQLRSAQMTAIQQPIVQQPTAQIKTFQSSGKTHGTISVSPNAYRVGASTVAGRQAAAPVYKAPGYKVPVYKASGANGNVGSVSSPFGNNLSASPMQSNVIQGRAASMQDNFFEGGEGGVYNPGNGDVVPGKEDKNDNTPQQPGGGVPMGNATLPLMLLLIAYAAFIAVRKVLKEA